MQNIKSQIPPDIKAIWKKRSVSCFLPGGFFSKSHQAGHCGFLFFAAEFWFFKPYLWKKYKTTRLCNNIPIQNLYFEVQQSLFNAINLNKSTWINFLHVINELNLSQAGLTQNKKFPPGNRKQTFFSNGLTCYNPILTYKVDRIPFTMNIISYFPAELTWLKTSVKRCEFQSL